MLWFLALELLLVIFMLWVGLKRLEGIWTGIRKLDADPVDPASMPQFRIVARRASLTELDIQAQQKRPGLEEIRSKPNGS